MNRELTQTTSRQVVEHSNLDVLKAKEKNLPVPRTCQDLFESPSKKFQYVTAVFGSSAIEKIISDSLIETCMHMSFQINEDQILKAAELIAEEWPLCMIADLKMFDSFVLSGKCEKRFRMDTIELCTMFREFIEHRETEFEQIRIAKKKELESKAAIDNEDEYKYFITKYAKRLEADYQASDKYLTFDEFCRLKYRPIENPTPIDITMRPRKLRGLPIRDLCAREGKDYDTLLSKEAAHWEKMYERSSVTSEMTRDEYLRYRRIQFDNGLRKELDV